MNHKSLNRTLYFEITEKTGSDEIYLLLDKVTSDLNEDVGKKMNDSDSKFLGNDGVDYNSGAVANASDILVPPASIHSLSSGKLSFNCLVLFTKSQPSGGGKALTRQVKKYNVSLQQTYYYFFLVIQGYLMSLRKPLIQISWFLIM